MILARYTQVVDGKWPSNKRWYDPTPLGEHSNIKTERNNEHRHRHMLLHWLCKQLEVTEGKIATHMESTALGCAYVKSFNATIKSHSQLNFWQFLFVVCGCIDNLTNRLLKCAEMPSHLPIDISPGIGFISDCVCFHLPIDFLCATTCVCIYGCVFAFWSTSRSPLKPHIHIYKFVLMNTLTFCSIRLFYFSQWEFLKCSVCLKTWAKEVAFTTIFSLIIQLLK